MKARIWYAWLPGYNLTYALSFEFEEVVSEREARAYVREWFKIKRLPPGTGVWPKEEA